MPTASSRRSTALWRIDDQPSFFRETATGARDSGYFPQSRGAVAVSRTEDRPKGHRMSTQTFLLPDVGEGLTEAEIVSWRVAPGDPVAVNDVLVEIETAKSLVELPFALRRGRRRPARRRGRHGQRRSGHHHDRQRRRVGTAGDRRSERARRAARRFDELSDRRRCRAGRLRQRGSRAVAAAAAGCGDQRRGGEVVGRRRGEAPDPQARARPRRRPHRRGPQRAGRRGDAAKTS